MDTIFQAQLPVIFLIFITWLLILKDRAFYTRMRIGFYTMLLLSLVLISTSNLAYYTLAREKDFYPVAEICRMILRPAILMIWLYVVLRKQEYQRVGRLSILAPTLINGVLCVLSIWNGWVYTISDEGVWQGGILYILPQAVYVGYMVMIVVFSIYLARKEETLEHIIIILIAMVILATAALEFRFSAYGLLDQVVTVGLCIYYFYLLTQVYKLDALTQIMNRHNLMYDLEELENREYFISMIDIDNFKSINDKYGHEKGDEALKKVVKVIQKNLTKKSRIYRYGGDEFAIISLKTTEQELNQLFARVNSELQTYDYRISYGIHKHLKGQSMAEAIQQADMLMYDNKRMLKSESIWDDMTGLFNLRGFLDELATMRKHALTDKKDICLVGFDVEHLGDVNLAYGYAEGNMIITTLGNIIKEEMDSTSFVGHLGSDEFVVALKVNKGDNVPPENLISKVLEAIRVCPELKDKEYTIEVNSAVHLFNPIEYVSMEKAVNDVLYQKQADKEQRRKSFTGRHDVEKIDPVEEATALDIIINNKFRYALQPIVSTVDGSIVAYEALMRTDTEPMLPPLTILRHAGNHDLFYTIEKYTFENVLQIVADKQQELQGRKVFLNSIPGFVLNDADYQELKEKYGTLLEQVVVEINEQSVLEDDELAVIKERQAMDRFGVAIDDYGSGNANTYSLLRIKPEIIKLDRLLITDIDRNTKKQYFVNSIITFAKENDMKVLAEGVETEAELKMVIRLKADYIQGYFTARPAMELIGEINEEVTKVIRAENIRTIADNKRKVYMASNPGELSLVQLALEEYNGIIVTASSISLQGNTDYVADMCIKVKEGVRCEIVLNNVRLNSVDDLPCLDIGEGAQVILKINGSCTMDQKGIHVPERAKLTTQGPGNLFIDTKGHDCYGIGCDHKEAFGSIRLMQSGKLSVHVDGDAGIAIGGGSYKGGSGIELCGGGYDISVASVDGVGIGCCYGDVPIKLQMCYVLMELRVAEGTGIGSRYGRQSIHCEHFTVIMSGSGAKLSGVGTNYTSGGTIFIAEGTFEIRIAGQNVNLMGVTEGMTSVSLTSCKLKLHGEGNEVLGIGSGDRNAAVHLQEVSSYVSINSANAVPFGTSDDGYECVGPEPNLHINE